MCLCSSQLQSVHVFFYDFVSFYTVAISIARILYCTVFTLASLWLNWLATVVSFFSRLSYSNAAMLAKYLSTYMHACMAIISCNFCSVAS